jgi:hypothetical protein
MYRGIGLDDDKEEEEEENRNNEYNEEERPIDEEDTFCILDLFVEPREKYLHSVAS